MREICPDKSCTGCLACKAVCGHNAIVCQNDALGFTHVRINENVCVNCGLCEKVCPTLAKPSRSEENIAFAAITTKDEVAKRSSSAGLATLISHSIIEKGGVVYGCSAKDPYNIRHIRVSSAPQLDELQSSKYVYSNLSEVYENIRKDLTNNLPVLFIGIPCQVAAVRKFLFKNYENLFTIDIVCHGAPSQKMLNEDLDYFKTKYQLSEIRNVRFRRKFHLPDGSLKIQYGMYFLGGDKEYFFDGIKDPFTLAYTHNQLLRDCCYDCQYTNIHRVSNLTLGDFWRLDPKVGFDKSNGVSLYLLHDKKGEELISMISDAIITSERTIEEAINGNPQLIRPTSRGRNLEVFRKLFIKKGIEKAARRANRKVLIRARLHTLAKKTRLISLVRKLSE